jgi:hypothetical protein
MADNNIQSDKNIKKIKILNKLLPDPTAQNKYLVRFRIVSEDRNRTSSYSPIFLLDASEPKKLNKDKVSYSVNNKIISLAWQDNENRSRYDIFIKFDQQLSYEYHGSTTSTNYTIINQTANSFRFAIQVSNISKSKSSQLEIYESSVISLV